MYSYPANRGNEWHLRWARILRSVHQLGAASQRHQQGFDSAGRSSLALVQHVHLELIAFLVLFDHVHAGGSTREAALPAALRRSRAHRLGGREGVRRAGGRSGLGGWAGSARRRRARIPALWLDRGRRGRIQHSPLSATAAARVFDLLRSGLHLLGGDRGTRSATARLRRWFGGTSRALARGRRRRRSLGDSLRSPTRRQGRSLFATFCCRCSLLRLATLGSARGGWRGLWRQRRRFHLPGSRSLVGLRSIQLGDGLRQHDGAYVIAGVARRFRCAPQPAKRLARISLVPECLGGL